MRRRAAAYAPENPGRVVVPPVVQQVHQQVEIRRRWRIDEEVAGGDFEPRRANGSGAGYHVRQVEQNPARSRRVIEDGRKQMTVPAADIRDDVETRVVVRIDQGRQHRARFCDHRRVEDLRLVLMLVEVAE